MELRHLRYFVAVAEERHFGRAAERLHMAQSPLSHAVRQLEAELGARLFKRTTRRVDLTPAGILLLDRARSILASIDGAVVDVARVEAGYLGRLAIGFTGSATYELLPRLSRVFRSEMPGVELELFGEMLTPRSVSGLVDGTLDLAFLRPPVRRRELAVHVLRREPLIAVLPEQHPLAGVGEVPLAELANEPFVTYPSAHRSVVHDAVLDACQRAGFEPRVAQEVGETSTLVAFVAAGVGVALVPASVRHLQISSAVYRPLEGPPATVTLALAHRRDDESAALRRVLVRVRELLGGQEPALPNTGPPPVNGE